MSNAPTVEAILEIIRDVDPMTVAVEELDPEGSLNEQGIDSLEMMNIFLGIEEAYGVKIPDEDIDSLDSVVGLLDYTKKLIAAI